MPLSALSGSRLSWGERRGTHGVFVFGGAFSVRRAGRAFFFSCFCRACCFFSYLCPWFSALCRGCSFVLFGFCRGGCCWVLVSPLSLCGFRARHPRGAWLRSIGSGGGSVSGVRWCLGRSGLVFLVGGLVGGFACGFQLGRVGRLGRDPRPWRSALFVFLIFFNSGLVLAARMPRVLRGKKFDFF